MKTQLIKIQINNPMKKALIFISLFLLIGCDYQGSYIFIVKNETSKNVVLKFSNNTDYSTGHSENQQTVTILKGVEKVIRIIDAPLNSPAHDCLNMHGMTFFEELAFDTYLDNVKIEKQLWLPENWTYRETSKWTAEYTLTLTEELCQ